MSGWKDNPILVSHRHGLTRFTGVSRTTPAAIGPASAAASCDVRAQMGLPGG
jgi:hypothetical protein